jgi:hypothetical protein
LNKIVKILTILLVWLFGVTAANAQGQDSLINQDVKLIGRDVKLVNQETKISLTDSLNKSFKPDPMRVVWMGAIIPGYGQIINRKYWKLPIVYGGFLGFAYAISWNNIRYNAYKSAYKDIIDSDPNTNSFIDILPSGYTVDTYGGVSSYTTVLKSAMEQTRYNRDLSIILTAGYYLLTLVDAYVDAQLYDFDITPDLSMRFSPTIMENRYGKRNTFGLQLSFKLK